MTPGGRILTGRKGEQLACDYLEGLGQVVLARNWRHSRQEIDIISLSQDNILHIVEVKSKREPLQVDPLDNIDRRKLRNLCIAAEAFLHSAECRALSSEVEVHFDVVTVIFGADGTKIEYYPQAYIPTYVQ